jgi:erythromycin esterase
MAGRKVARGGLGAVAILSMLVASCSHSPRGDPPAATQAAASTGEIGGGTVSGEEARLNTAESHYAITGLGRVDGYPTLDECRSGVLSSLSIVHPWQGSVELDQVRCLEVRLQEGEFIRAAVEMDTAGFRSMAAFGLEIYAPGRFTPVQRWSVSNVTSTRGNLSWEAIAGGSYHVLLRYTFALPQAPEIPARVWIESVESPDQVQARREALARDARVDWLRENANPIRSISPDDTDFSDLEFLRDALRDVRIVLLGEADHNAGTDFIARSRLVKFLHQELDFDVLAFEAPLHGMAAAWDSIRAGAPVRDALRTGLWGFWSHAEQMQSLVAYIGEQAGGDRPLEVAGFDNRPWIDPWRRNTLPRFATDLGEFLRRQGTPGALGDPGSPEYAILEVLAGQRSFVDHPAPEEQAAFLRAIDGTVAQLGASTEKEARFWAEALRGAGCHARYEGGIGDTREDERCFRDVQMGEHLLWLANERYPDRKIVAWAATAHVMRDPEFRDGRLTGPAMGKVLWDALGEESYAIGMTSYRHTEDSIVTDQHLMPEFEELMEAAGFDHAVVDLREAAREGTWLGGSFLARPNMHFTEQRIWSEVLDALFFVREQEPRRQVRNP